MTSADSRNDRGRLVEQVTTTSIGAAYACHTKAKVDFVTMCSLSVNMLAALVALFSTLTAFPTIYASTESTSCLKYLSGSAPGQGYAASWEALHFQTPLLVKRDCSTSGTNLTLTVGKGDPSREASSTAYSYTGTSKQTHRLSGPAASGWIAGQGTKQIAAPSTASPANLLIPLDDVCTRDKGAWKCGCADSACTQSMWQPQAYTDTSQGTTTGAGRTVANEFSCLGSAQTRKVLPGIVEKLKTTILPDEAVDARNTFFKITKERLINIRHGSAKEVNMQNAVWIPKGPAGGCFAGGRIESDFGICASWGELKAYDPGSISWGQDNMKIQGIYMHNVEDALRPHDGADVTVPSSPANTKFDPGDNFEVSHIWAEYVRDDCLENDAYAGGIIRDSLFDGCNSGFSETPGMRTAQIDPSDEAEARAKRSAVDGSGKIVTLDGVLLRMQAMPNPNNPKAGDPVHNGTVYGGGPLFKVMDKAPRFSIKNSIFAFDTRSSVTYNFPPLRECSNNTIVWLGGGSFPGNYPRNCFSLTTDVNIWKNAVKDWHVRNPNVGKSFKPPVEKMGDVSWIECSQ